MTESFVSVYEPIQIQIDGQSYPLRKRTREVMRKLYALQESLDKADTDIARLEFGYDQLALLIDAPQEIIDGLDARQVGMMSKWLGHIIAGKAAPGEQDGKNPERPGDEKSPA